jgi:5-methylcytosine-specific restriction endonuclease McrA
MRATWPIEQQPPLPPEPSVDPKAQQPIGGSRSKMTQKQVIDDLARDAQRDTQLQAHRDWGQRCWEIKRKATEDYRLAVRNNTARCEAQARAQANQEWQTAFDAWTKACAEYERQRRADPTYQQAVRDMWEAQQREPQRVDPEYDGRWFYRNLVVDIERHHSDKPETWRQDVLEIKRYVLRHERSQERLRQEVDALENMVSGPTRAPIPEAIRTAVWRRDQGKCVQCSSNRDLEFDHIIPVAKGGANTARNLQLLCEPCNRSKGASI